MATHVVFSKEELARVEMHEDTLKFYSSTPDALKELILERDYYKSISQMQQTLINEFSKIFIKKVDKIIPKNVLSYRYSLYYNDNLYAQLDWNSFAKF